MVLDNGEYWNPQDFQLDFVKELFDGCEEAWLIIPEGNGKTTLMSGFELYHGDYTPSAKVVVGASSRDQCKILHDQAAGFVRRSPGLNKRFRVFDGYRRIDCLGTDGQIQVFAADDRTGDGVIPTLALLDELHRHRDLRLYRTWRGKLAKRGGQLGAISTAGEPDSEFEIIRQGLLVEAESIKRKGAFTRAQSGRLVLHDYAVPAAGDIDDFAQVKAANPLASITVNGLREKRASPTMTKNHWRRFVCNQAVRVNVSSIDEAEWDSCSTSERIPAGESVQVGVDLGWKWDTTAIVPLSFRSKTDRLFGVPTILTPPRDGTSLHPSKVQSALRRLHERNPISTVVLDPSAGGEQLAAWLEDELGVVVVSHSQTKAPMSLAYERFMEAFRQGWLRHPGDKEFTRHVLNGVDDMGSDGVTRFGRPSSSRNAEKQDRRVIDALIAAAMVNSVAAAQPSKSPSRKAIIL